MAENELNVIVKAKELCVHSFMLTSNINRYAKMVKLLCEGKITEEKFQASYGAWKNHISHGNCKNLSKKMDKLIESKKNSTPQETQGAIGKNV